MMSPCPRKSRLKYGGSVVLVTKSKTKTPFSKDENALLIKLKLSIRSKPVKYVVSDEESAS